MTLATRIAVMDAGHIRQFGDPASIYDDPADLFVAGFMGSPPMNMIPGRVRRNGGLFVEPRDAPDGLLFPLPPETAGQVSVSDGHEVVLGLRPETIFAAGTELPGANRFLFSRPVSVVEPTGPDTMIVFEIGDMDLVARVRPEDSRATGEIFDFEVDMSKAKLFDAETGRAF